MTLGAKSNDRERQKAAPTTTFFAGFPGVASQKFLRTMFVLRAVASFARH